MSICWSSTLPWVWLGSSLKPWSTCCARLATPTSLRHPVGSPSWNNASCSLLWTCGSPQPGPRPGTAHNSREMWVFSAKTVGYLAKRTFLSRCFCLALFCCLALFRSVWPEKEHSHKPCQYFYVIFVLDKASS